MDGPGEECASHFLEGEGHNAILPPRSRSRPRDSAAPLLSSAFSARRAPTVEKPLPSVRRPRGVQRYGSVRITSAFYRVIYRAVNNRDITHGVQSPKGQEEEREGLFEPSCLKITEARQKQRLHQHLFDNFPALTCVIGKIRCRPRDHRALADNTLLYLSRFFPFCG